MANETLSVPTMHEDHVKWQSEQSMWKLDLVSWRKQMSAAFAELDELRQILETQHRALAEHEAVINAQQQALLAHEQDLAVSEHYGIEYLDSLTQKHLNMTGQIDSQREMHEKIKHYHHELMAKLAAVEKTIQSAAG